MILSVSYEIEVYSQSSIYNKLNTISNNRKLKVYFSLPQNGVNEDTGLLLLIAGYGGKASSNVYKKMRNVFSDQYNLVTIQCDYFGYEFMQTSDKLYLPHINKQYLNEMFSYEEVKQIYDDNKFNFSTFSNLCSKHSIKSVQIGADLSGENIDNFNDMGIMQSIDNITAVLNVMNILYDNDLYFNSKKVIVYGHSHGAYLAYLCNAFAPSLFSLIIDNSSWITPVYLYKARSVSYELDKLTVLMSYQYLAKKIITDNEILNLSYVYSKFRNNCNIISYHGTTDDLISCHDKAIFCNEIDKCIYNEISQDKIDNVIFKSTNHGLDADFIKLFNFTMDNFNIQFKKSTSFDLEDKISFKTSQHEYIIDYKNVVPQVYML